MTAFVDASVLVAIVVQEPDHLDWLDRLQSTPDLITSPIAVWEAVRAVARVLHAPVPQVAEQLFILLDGLGIDVVPVGKAEGETAVIAHQRYGKGNHPARLNLGDCFAYACTKTNDAKLFYKGNDFAETDLA